MSEVMNVGVMNVGQSDDDNVNIFHPQKMVRVPSTPLAALISCQDYNWFGLSRGICACCLVL